MKWLFGVGAVGVLLIVGLSIYLQPNDFGLCPMSDQPVSREGCHEADAIVVVSGGDTVARTAHAIDLYNNGWAPRIVFSGAAEDKSGPSNASAMREQARVAGVPLDAIIVEELSSNTRENADNTAKLLVRFEIQDIILVTSGYHMRRTGLEFHRALDGYSIKIRSSPTFDKDWSLFWWLTPRGWYLAVSEVVKIIALKTGSSS